MVVHSILNEMNWPQTPWLGHPLAEWLRALAIALAALAAAVVLQRLLAGRLARLARRTASELAGVAADLVRRTRWFLVLFPALYLGSLSLGLPPRLREVLRAVAILAFLLQIALWALVTIDFWVARARRRRLAADAAAATLIGALAFAGKAVLWTVVLLLALANLGIDVTALVTGLGVGGIAIALAVQNILGDVLASLSIVVDKPFVVGDAITVGDFSGTVERIGLKTTHLRSNSGEQVIFPNHDLLQSRIRNWKRMAERRVVLAFGVDPGTPPAALERVPGLLYAAIAEQDSVRFERAHFKGFGDSALLFEAVYWVLTPDYGTHMDRQQAIDLALLRGLAEEGIALASGARTVVIERPAENR
jgi:small-conductance mechanosensitive channel